MRSPKGIPLETIQSLEQISDAVSPEHELEKDHLGNGLNGANDSGRKNSSNQASENNREDQRSEDVSDSMLFIKIKDRCSKFMDIAYKRKLLTNDEYLRGKTFLFKKNVSKYIKFAGETTVVSESHIVKKVFKIIERNSHLVLSNRLDQNSLWNSQDLLVLLNLISNINKIPATRVKQIFDRTQKDDPEQLSFLLGFLLNRYTFSDYASIIKKRFSGNSPQKRAQRKTPQKSSRQPNFLQSHSGMPMPHMEKNSERNLQRPGMVHRPTSPLPQNQNLKIWLNSKGAKYFKETHLAILKHLLLESNEHLVSSYDVFSSDKDEDEFVDTLRRIIKRKRRNENRGRSGREQIKVVNNYTIDTEDGDRAGGSDGQKRVGEKFGNNGLSKMKDSKGGIENTNGLTRGHEKFIVKSRTENNLEVNSTQNTPASPSLDESPEPKSRIGQDVLRVK